MQTLVIGDIHGCYDELQALLDKADLTEDDSIVSIGGGITPPRVHSRLKVKSAL